MALRIGTDNHIVGTSKIDTDQGGDRDSGVEFGPMTGNTSISRDAGCDMGIGHWLALRKSLSALGDVGTIGRTPTTKRCKESDLVVTQLFSGRVGRWVILLWTSSSIFNHHIDLD
ncbi:hypothetical protein Lal_00042528 [Lupinus albus]|nr:hypothetical protein Lal_00042528 [Lupinus albus]